MKLLVGLGNPGARHAGSRHNVGFAVAERFAERCGFALDESAFGGRFGRGRLAGARVAALEPTTFMNRSGDAVARAVTVLGLDPAADLLVAFDDVDLPFGRLRLRPRGGAGGHRGVAHILERLGGGEFARLRFGVGRPPPPLDTAEYVLAPFSEEESAALPAALTLAAQAAECAFREGVAAAMDAFNRDPAAPSPSG